MLLHCNIIRVVIKAVYIGYEYFKNNYTKNQIHLVYIKVYYTMMGYNNTKH